jgi:propanol-preferring alcohol dehydrogenase
LSEVNAKLGISRRGIVKTHIRTEKMEKLTDIFQEMKDGKLIGRVVIDLQ